MMRLKTSSTLLEWLMGIITPERNRNICGNVINDPTISSLGMVYGI
ncbi:hypothetical protein ACYUJ6_16405 [Clostridium sp. JNZ X4-2]